MLGLTRRRTDDEISLSLSLNIYSSYVACLSTDDRFYMSLPCQQNSVVTCTAPIDHHIFFLYQRNA